MSKRLHIAHFTNTYHPVVSGVVRSVSTFRQALTELGHNVFVFAQEAGDYDDHDPFIFRFPAKLDLPGPTKFPLTIPVYPGLDDLLGPLKLDVVHSHHPFLLGQVAASKAADFNLPLVFTFHTRYREYSHYLPLDQKFVKNAIDRWLGDYMQKCQHIIVPSASMKGLLADQYGVTDRVSAIATGIDLTPFQSANRQTIRQERGWNQDKVLISIGRLAKEKNWETLLAAVALVMDTRDDVRLILIGDGDQRKDLEHYARQLGIAERVEFTGKIPFADVPGFLKAADLFCFASVTETQGLVTMEAMAADLPVVAVDATGTRDEVEHGQEGLLTSNDKDSLAQALEQVLGDDALCQHLKAGARKKAESLDSLLQAKKLVTAYDQAIDDKRADFFINVDKRKKIFKFTIEDGWWRKLFD